MKECRVFYFQFLTVCACLCLALSACSSQSKQKHIARGEEYLQKSRFQESVMEFRAAADIDKTSAEAHWGMARALESLGQFNEAAESLRRTVELNPENLEAKIKLGNYLLHAQPQQISETEQLLEEVFARDANFVPGHILKASLFAAQKKNEKEIFEVLNHAVALDPKRTDSYASLSRFLMKLGRKQEAEATIQKAVSVNPDAADAYLEYGRFLTFVERASEAEAKYARAVEVEPSSVEAREAQAEFYLGQRQLEKAEQVYQEAVRIQENSLASRMKLANFYALVNREDDAIRVFSDIITGTPQYARARYRLGEIHLDRRENQKAVEQTEELLRLNADDAEAFMLRARVAMQENRVEDAVRDLEEVLKKQPSQKNALFYMTQARLALGQTEQARAFIGDLEKYHPNFLKTKLLKIQASFSGGEPESAFRQANELLEAVKKSYPTADTDAQSLEELRVRATTARGLANLEIGNLAEAKTDLQAVRTLSPNSSAASVNLAKVFVAEKNLAEAANLYEKALTSDNRNFDALGGLTSVLTRQGQFDAAHAKINQAIETSAGRKDLLPALHYLKANVFTAQKNVEAAEAELKRAIEIDDAYLPAYTAYASILVGRNQTGEAVEQYKKVVERKPSAAAHTLIGMLEDVRGNAPEAETNYRRALEIAPASPIAANNLAWLLAANGGNLDEALMLAQAAVAGNQSTAVYFDTLGWIYFKKELYSPAVEQLRKAVALDEAEANRNGNRANSTYRLRLGMALASAGDKPAARKEVEISLQNEQNLSEKDAQDAKILLASL
jgi:tetratricopeptide (TPR) repeat protein